MKSNGSQTSTVPPERWPLGSAGDVPIISDWNADGQGDTGVCHPSQGHFYLDSDGSRNWGPEDLTTEPLATETDVPVSGDWNADGKDELGVQVLR